MLTREQRLVYCKACENRKFDVHQGIVCGLSGEKAIFNEPCPDYEEDYQAAENEAQKDYSLDPQRALARLSDQEQTEVIEQQNFTGAFVAGMSAALLLGFLWAMTAYASGWSVRLGAIGVGLGVGFTVRLVGRGFELKYGAIAVVATLFSWCIGQYLILISFVALELDFPFLKALFWADFVLLLEYFFTELGLFDLVYLFVALAAAFKYGRAPIKSPSARNPFRS